MLKLVAYESSCKTTIIFPKDYEQERYDYWLNDFMSNKRVKKIIKIDDNENEEIILER